jgi:cysteine-rich repeat protein
MAGIGRETPYALGLCLAGLLAASTRAEVTPAGPEFQISRGHNSAYSYYDGYTLDPKITRTTGGDFVVVWEETQGPYDIRRVAAKRMGRDGTGGGSQFTIFQPVDDCCSYELFHPEIAALPDDGFVVVWADAYDMYPQFGRVFAQRFDHNNDPLEAPVQVNETEAVTNDFNSNGLATGPDGDFLVVWEALEPYPSRVMARYVSAAGVPTGSDFRVDESGENSLGFPVATSDPQGNFTAIWQDWGGINPHPPDPGTFARRVDTDGNVVGSEFVIFDHDNDLSRNAVATAPDGTSMVLGFIYGGYRDLTARIYDVNWMPVTPEFDINGSADYNSVTADPDGNFVVVWRDRETYNVHGQRFSPTGQALGDVFEVTENPQYAAGNFPDVATDEAGDFVVVWANNYYSYSNGQYTYSLGAWARRFAVCGNGRIGLEDGCDDGNTTALDGCSTSCTVETCHSCSGDPSVCSQMPGCTAVCTNPAPIQPNTTALGFKGIGAPGGDEGMAFKGKVLNPPLAHLEWDPSSDGLELALTTTGLVYGIFGTTALPPGPPGSGCDPARDGWKTKPGSYVYKNVSNALPPGCTPGSANGVRVVKVKDKLDRDGTIQFRVKARNASIALAPAPPLTATVILGTSPAAGAAGRCGQITFTGAIGTRFFP